MNNKLHIPTPMAPHELAKKSGEEYSSSDDNDFSYNIFSYKKVISFDSTGKYAKKKNTKFVIKRFMKKLCKRIGIKPTRGGALINEALRRELLAYTTDGIAQSVHEISLNEQCERDHDKPKLSDYPKSIHDKRINVCIISQVSIKHNWALLETPDGDFCIDEKNDRNNKHRINVKNCCPSYLLSRSTASFIKMRKSFNDLANTKPINDTQQSLIQITENNENEEINKQDLDKKRSSLLLRININYKKKKKTKKPKRSLMLSPKENSQFLLKRNKRFTTYAPIIFRYIRRVIMNISDEEYISSIIPKNEKDQIRVLDSTKTGTGKSGAFFYFTHDKRFIVKTIKKHEVEHLLNILRDYVYHLKKYPSTILCRCIGLHSLTLYGKTKYFVIMENVFVSKKLQPHEKYDLKGSWVGRYTNHRLHSGQVMKDIDLKRYVIVNKNKRIGIMKQLSLDTKFLQKHQIMDYSLLLGIYHMKIEYDADDDEESDYYQSSSTDIEEDDDYHMIDPALTNNDIDTKQSPAQSPTETQTQSETTSTEDEPEPNSITTPIRHPQKISIEQMDDDMDDLVINYNDDDDEKITMRFDEAFDDVFDMSNLSLLSSLSYVNNKTIDVRKINIHDDVYSGGVRAQIIEGPGIYYFGIIDSLQKYGWKKRLETWIRKWIQRKDVRGISCIAPDKYRLRFMRYMDNIFIDDKKYKYKLKLIDKKFEKEQLKIYPPRQLIKKNIENLTKSRHSSLHYVPPSVNKLKVPTKIPLQQSSSLPALTENKPKIINNPNKLLILTQRKK